MNDFERLSRKQQKFLPLFLASSSVTEAAQQAGISEATIYRWLDNSAFQAAYRRARYKLIESSIHKLSTLGDSAVQSLSDVLTAHNSSPQARVSAAKLILESLLKVVELEQLENRINELEERLNGAERYRQTPSGTEPPITAGSNGNGFHG